MSEPAWVPIGPSSALDVGPEVAYQELQGAVSVTATTEGTSNLVITAPAFVADGSSSYLVEFFAPYCVCPAASGGGLYLVLQMDGVSQGYFSGMLSTVASPAFAGPLRLMRRITPAAGSHVFRIVAFASSSSSITGGTGVGGSYVPGFIRVTKVPSAVAGLGGLVPPSAIGTVLPASPVDGQRFILTDSLTAPTYTWDLQYMAAKASNKWVFVGGAPAVSALMVDGTSTTVNTTVDLSTYGPAFIVPRPGRYLAVGSATAVHSSGTGVTQAALILFDTPGGGATAYYNEITGANYNASVAIQHLHDMTAAGQEIRLRYAMFGGAGTQTWRERLLQVTPIALS